MTAVVTTLATLVGLALVVLAVVDEYVTTVAMRGGGPVSSRVTDALWRRALRRASGDHRRLARYGTAMIGVVVLTWTMLLYLGWTLVFVAHPDAVVAADGGAPAGLVERGYYTGYVMTTLGNGELRPGGTPWRAATVLASLSGLAMITLAITYLMPVLGGVVHKRQVARTIDGFGSTVEGILGNAWDGSGFPALTTHLGNLVPELTALAQQHMAYPVLHHAHSQDRRTALAPAIAELDGVLTLLRFGVRPAHRPDAVTLAATAAGVEVLLEALEAAHIDPVEEPPPPPSLDLLARLDIPTVDAAEYARATAALGPRRALLRAFVDSDGWRWTL